MGEASKKGERVRVLDDNDIIELYQARAESAIGETSLKYGGYCLKIAMNILQLREDSEECVNDTYLNAWNSIPPQNPVRLSAFLGRITRNLALNRYRAKRAQKRGGAEVELLLSELEDCVPAKNSVEEEFEIRRVAELIERFLASSDEANRIVFTRRYWYADSIKSISERFNMSESKVKSMLFRLRGRLREYLEKEGVNI